MRCDVRAADDVMLNLIFRDLGNTTSSKRFSGFVALLSMHKIFR